MPEGDGRKPDKPTPPNLKMPPRGIMSWMLFLALALMLVVLLGFGTVVAQEPDPSLLTLDRIFTAREFMTLRFGLTIQWLKNGESYTVLEPSDFRVEKKSIVLYNI